MSFAPRRAWLSVLSCLVIAGFSVEQVASLAWSFEDGKDKPKETATEKKTEGDIYAVPEGSPAELLKFIDNLRNNEPQGLSTSQGIREHLTKSNQAILAAADKILEAKPDEATRVAAVKAKFESLTMLRRLNLASADKLLELAEAYQQDKNKDLANDARFYVLFSQLAKADAGNLAEMKPLVERVKEQLKGSSLDRREFSLAMNAARMLEQAEHYELAADTYRQFAAILAKSSNKQIADYAAKMEGSARRLSLMGNPIEVNGVLLDGKKFDWSAYKGKVVLVDFWATWCGPCIGELPNVLANYDLYHKRGFDVIGISLDTDAQKVEQFVENRKIPWPILYGDTDATRGWEHPMATYYGIMGIPTAILVNQQGKVVTLHARGPELGRLLGELIGPPEEKPADKPEEEKKDDKKGPAKKRPDTKKKDDKNPDTQ